MSACYAPDAARALTALAADIAAWVDAHPGDCRLHEAREIGECAAIAARHPEIVRQPEALVHWRQEWETLRAKGEQGW